MRWWLGLAFALVAGLTALAAAVVFSERADRALAERAGELAIGSSVVASDRIKQALVEGTLGRVVSEVAQERRIALYVFDSEGNLLSPERSRRTLFEAVPRHTEALEAALAGERYAETLEGTVATVVGLPLRAAVGTGAEIVGALVAYVPQPAYAVSQSLLDREIILAASIAFPVGAIAGLLIAALLAARLRRIGAAARAIEQGDFGTELTPKFHDELGALALTINRMRQRLADSFERLKAERDKLERLLERLRDGVIMVGRDLRVEVANASARRALGAPLLEGDPLPDPWESPSLRELARTLLHPGGQVFQSRVTVEASRAYALLGIPAAREGESAVMVITDVSEQERREQAEREFVANAAHELRTPLTAILSAVEVLQAGAKEIPEDRDRFLSSIAQEASRLSRLSRAMLVLARAQTGQQSPALAAVRVRPLLEDVVARLSVAPGVAVVVDCPADLEALSEPDLLEQIVSNLATNAAKHTSEGTIRIVATPSGSDIVAISVADTGPGIAPHEQERIFDRFYRGGARSSEGFGLGLSIVQHAVRAIGGTIDLQSRPGTGTTVTVELPAAPDCRTETNGREARKPASAS